MFHAEIVDGISEDCQHACILRVELAICDVLNDSSSLLMRNRGLLGDIPVDEYVPGFGTSDDGLRDP